MSLPKIELPVFSLILPLSKKEVRFRPFTVKEQKVLLMAVESDDKETVEMNIKQILNNCTVSNNIDVEILPVLDIEYYFLKLRSKSIGEIVENKYVCNNEVDGIVCGNKMNVEINISDIEVEFHDKNKDIIQINNNISLKLKYPDFSSVNKLSSKETSVDLAFQLITDSIEWIFDGEQYFYANESTPKELSEFIESLNVEQFSKIEQFFDTLPKLRKEVEVKCGKCGYLHKIVLEGLENFFG